MEIKILTRAIRQLKKLPPDVRKEIAASIGELADWPQTRNVKSLHGRDDYRLRVGRYRVIFEVTGLVIHITEIIIRNEKTY